MRCLTLLLTFALAAPAEPYLVRLVHMRRTVKDRDADWESFWAALTFAVPKKAD